MVLTSSCSSVRAHEISIQLLMSKCALVCLLNFVLFFAVHAAHIVMYIILLNVQFMYIQPMLERVRMHPLLVTASKEKEISPER